MEGYNNYEVIKFPSTKCFDVPFEQELLIKSKLHPISPPVESSLSLALVAGIAGGVGGALFLVIIVLVIIVCVLMCQVRRRSHMKVNISGKQAEYHKT